MPLSKETLKELFVRNGHAVPDDALAPMLRYLTLLMKWNAVIGLTGARTVTEIVEKHCIDSVILAETFVRHGTKKQPVLYDLGSGAGLPGIPLRILWQEGSCTLVEKRGKRASFLRNALASLDLGETRVFEGFAEDLPRGQADFIVSKAFLPIPKLLPLARTLLAEKGMLAVLAGHSHEEDENPLLNDWHCVCETAYTADSRPRFLWLLEQKNDACQPENDSPDLQEKH